GRELTQHYPRAGWGEHDAEESWLAGSDVILRGLAGPGVTANALPAVGVPNQRGTVVVGERDGGKPVAHAIVWQDRRTADFCRERQRDQEGIRERTGRVLDPYFSGTKLRWLLEQDAGLRARAEAGKLACGTID